MERKIAEYFEAGSTYVWIVDPVAMSFTVYSTPDTFSTLSGRDVIYAPTVLAGFSIAVEEIIRRAGVRPA